MMKPPSSPDHTHARNLPHSKISSHKKSKKKKVGDNKEATKNDIFEYFCYQVFNHFYNNQKQLKKWILYNEFYLYLNIVIHFYRLKNYFFQVYNKYKRGQLRNDYLKIVKKWKCKQVEKIWLNIWSSTSHCI